MTGLEAVIKPLCATMETMEKRLERAESIAGRVGVMERDMAGNAGVSSRAASVGRRVGGDGGLRSDK